MAEPGNKDPAIDPAEGGSQEVGERMSSLETQLSQLRTLVSTDKFCRVPTDLYRG